MKRYQCIKNVWAEPELIYPEGGRLLLFRAGDVYNEYDCDSWTELTDDLGNVHVVTSKLLDSFKELPQDLPIPGDPHGTYWDHDSHEYAALNPAPGCTRGIALCLAAIATSGIIIYLALTWRS